VKKHPKLALYLDAVFLYFALYKNTKRIVLGKDNINLCRKNLSIGDKEKNRGDRQIFKKCVCLDDSILKILYLQFCFLYDMIMPKV